MLDRHSGVLDGTKGMSMGEKSSREGTFRPTFRLEGNFLAGRAKRHCILARCESLAFPPVQIAGMFCRACACCVLKAHAWRPNSATCQCPKGADHCLYRSALIAATLDLKVVAVATVFFKYKSKRGLHST